MATLQELEKIYDRMRSDPSDEAQAIAPLIKREINRRKKSGRKVSNPLTRREQNRINVQNHRAKKKLAK